MAERGSDILIIGAGHNALACAFYLAERGLKVTMLEARSVVGGAAVTEEFHPGFRNSTASYTVSLLNPKVISDMRLYEHGLKVVLRKIDNFLPTLGRRLSALRPRGADQARDRPPFAGRRRELRRLFGGAEFGGRRAPAMAAARAAQCRRRPRRSVRAC